MAAACRRTVRRQGRGSHRGGHHAGHPGDYPACPRAVSEAVTLAIGPEGGWIPYEVDKLQEAGLAPVQLGERILRVETAVTALLARLF